MAQFRFSLERIMRWRAIELAREEAQLQRLIQEQIRLQMLVATLGDERSKLETSLAGLPDLRGQDLRAMAAYDLRLRREIGNVMQAVARCERDLAAQKKKYNQAKQRLRLLEELKERNLKRWQYEQARELEALASESYLAAWNREAR
jgi:flagellar export protein FliJ